MGIRWIGSWTDKFDLSRSAAPERTPTAAGDQRAVKGLSKDEMRMARRPRGVQEGTLGGSEWLRHGVQYRDDAGEPGHGK